MNRIKYKFTLGTTTKEQMYKYELRNYSEGNRLIYSGKIFKLPNQTELTVDVTDILTIFQYKGLGLLQLTWNGSNYTQPTETTTNLNSGNELHLSSISATLYNENNTQVATQTKQVYFHTIGFESERVETIIDNTTYYTDFSLIPRMPITNKLRFGKILYTTANKSVQWKDKEGNILHTFPRLKGSRVHNIDVPSEDLYVEKQKILQIDKECIADYYLLWLTQSGDLQAQPFNAKYSETHTTNKKLSSDEQQTIANSQTKGSWSLKSNILSDNYYKQYMDIYQSPYLMLYVSEIDRAYFVNVVGDKVEKKTYQNNNNKPLIFEVEVESVEQELNLY
jgi:hypothetical protein